MPTTKTEKRTVQREIEMKVVTYNWEDIARLIRNDAQAGSIPAWSKPNKDEIRVVLKIDRETDTASIKIEATYDVDTTPSAKPEHPNGEVSFGV